MFATWISNNGFTCNFAISLYNKAYDYPTAGLVATVGISQILSNQFAKLCYATSRLGHIFNNIVNFPL